MECCKDPKNLLEYTDNKSMCFSCGSWIVKEEEKSYYVSEKHYYIMQQKKFKLMLMNSNYNEEVYNFLLVEKEAYINEIYEKLNLSRNQIQNAVRTLGLFRAVYRIKGNNKDRIILNTEFVERMKLIAK